MFARNTLFFWNRSLFIVYFATTKDSSCRVHVYARMYVYGRCLSVLVRFQRFDWVFSSSLLCLLEWYSKYRQTWVRCLSLYAWLACLHNKCSCVYQHRRDRMTFVGFSWARSLTLVILAWTWAHHVFALPLCSPCSLTKRDWIFFWFFIGR